MKPVNVEAAEGEEAEGEAPEEPIQQTLAMDELKIELGYGLLPLINEVEGRRLTDQIKALRRQLAQDMGFVTPSVRILDNLQLEANAYVLKVKEIVAGDGELRVKQLMAMDPAGRQVDLPGEHVKEPAFNLPATWIEEQYREEATFRNYTIVDPATVLTTHLTEVLREHMPDLLTFAQTERLLADLEDEHKTLLNDVILKQTTRSTIQRVLQSLLKERVSIRDLPAILEGVAEATATSSDLTQIVEHVRGRLARQLCAAHQSHDGALPVISMSAEWEQKFAEALIGEGVNRQLALAPTDLHQFVQDLRAAFDAGGAGGDLPVLLTSVGVRPYVRSLVERFRPQTPVISQNEIHARAKLRSVGQV